MTVYTWEKDSHGLYDYEATKLHKDNYEIQGPCKIFRNWLTTQTCALSNDKVKKGELPDGMFSFHASISLKHNGNFERTIILIQSSCLGSLKSPLKIFTAKSLPNNQALSTQIPTLWFGTLRATKGTQATP